jgi:exodeoxyribonuclease V gamma subunit
MLRVYHSNRLDVLEALMEFIVERQRLDDPFMPEMVLVQSTGMAQWLQMTLAKRFGIAANIDFPLPGELYLGHVCPRIVGYPRRKRLQ